MGSSYGFQKRKGTFSFLNQEFDGSCMGNLGSTSNFANKINNLHNKSSNNLTNPNNYNNNITTNIKLNYSKYPNTFYVPKTNPSSIIQQLKKMTSRTTSMNDLNNILEEGQNNVTSELNSEDSSTRNSIKSMSNKNLNCPSSNNGKSKYF
jgi:hypothetical protein